MNPKKNLFFDPLTVHSHGPQPHPEKLKALLFQKYFPKYLKNFSLSPYHNSAKSKIKKTKIIRSLHLPLSSSQSHKQRAYLAHKAKFMKTLTFESISSTSFLKEINFFPKLTSIRFFFPKDPDDVQEDLPKGVFKRIKGLKQLKCLQIENLSNDHFYLIMRLNDIFPKFLSSFNTFSVSFAFRGGSDVETYEALEYFKNFSRKITSLQLGKLCSPYHQEHFQSLLSLCPNLSRLSFELTCREVHSDPRRRRGYYVKEFPVETNYLSSVNNLQNLKSLELNISDTLTFFKDFTAPPSVQNLLLNFKEDLCKQVLFQIEKKFPQKKASTVFKENETLVKFYNQFSSLHNLETLQVLFRYSDEDQNSLLQNILRKIPALRKLIFASPPKSKDLVADLHLPQLLESCHHLSETLQTLELGHERLVFSKFDLSSSRKKFAKLSTVIITGRFADPETNFYFFLDQIISLGDSIKSIKLSTTVNCNVNFLLALFYQLYHLKKQSSVKIELEIRFIDSGLVQDLQAGFEEVIGGLEENQEDLLQGVILNIQMNKIFAKYLQGLWPVYGKRFEGLRLIEN